MDQKEVNPENMCSQSLAHSFLKIEQVHQYIFLFVGQVFISAISETCPQIIHLLALIKCGSPASPTKSSSATVTVFVPRKQREMAGVKAELEGAA